MTRKTFFKTILGAVGGISVLSQLDKPKIRTRDIFSYFRKQDKAEVLALAQKIRDRKPDWLKAYHKGVEQAQNEVKGDHHQESVLWQTQEGGTSDDLRTKTHVLADFDSSHWQSRASV